MDLDTLIAQLQAIRESHGNLNVAKHDCEWGIEVPNLTLAKLVTFYNEKGTQYDQEMIDSVQSQIDEHDITLYEKVWDEDTKGEYRACWESREEYLKMMEDHHEKNKKLIEDFNVTPFSVII